MTLTITERVAAGAAWLDEHEPGWIKRIDIGVLDISSCANCVLGQVFGDFDDARRDAWLNPPEHDRMTDPGRRRGFMTPDPGAFEQYETLTAEWKRFIQERRAVTP